MYIKKNISAILVIFSVFFILNYSSDPILYGDSSRYLNFSLKDPPLYSFFINSLQIVFEDLSLVVIFQTIFIGVAIILFTKTLSDNLKLDTFIGILITLFLFLPIIKFYRMILTEPIGYAFTLFFFNFAFRLIYNFSLKNLFGLTFFAIALLLTRNQFLYLYLVLFFFYQGIFILYRSKKNFIYLLTSILIIFFTHNSIVKLSIHLKMNSLNTEMSFINEKNKYGLFYYTYIDAIYISNDKNIKMIKNEKMKTLLLNIFQEMNNKKALNAHYNGRGHYGSSFNEIRFYSDPLIEELASRQKLDINEVQKRITFVLIKKNFIKYITHIFKKFYDATWLFVLLPLIMLFISFFSFIKQKGKFSLFTFFLSIFTVGNHSTVYFLGRMQPRYLIYSDIILLMFVGLILFIFLEKKSNN